MIIFRGGKSGDGIEEITKIRSVMNSLFLKPYW